MNERITKETYVATERWQTAFDLIGLAAYMTLMTGELPDPTLLRRARRGTGPQLLELPAKADRSETAEPSAPQQAVA